MGRCSAGELGSGWGLRNGEGARGTCEPVVRCCLYTVYLAQSYPSRPTLHADPYVSSRHHMQLSLGTALRTAWLEHATERFGTYNLVDRIAPDDCLRSALQAQMQPRSTSLPTSSHHVMTSTQTRSQTRQTARISTATPLTPSPPDGSVCEPTKAPWEKVLWRKQPYADNYVPPSFLAELNDLRESDSGRANGLRLGSSWSTLHASGVSS